MQAGAQVAQIPQIAPVADEIMKSAGYRVPNPMGQDPNYPTAAMPVAPVGSEQLPQVQQNTSPAMPPVPQQALSPMKGVETPRTTDNLG